MSAHLSDDQLLERLYGAEAHPHADSCAKCAARLGEFERRRAELAAPVAVSAEFLAAQRRQIAARLEKRTRLRWIPALAAASAIAIGIVMFQPSPPPAPHTEPGDEQLFAEVYSMEKSTEPRAAAPIHALFEDAH